MKVLLISPPFIRSGKPSVKTAPLGLGYIAAMLESKGHPVSILDLFDLSNLRAKIKQANPDIIGISINMSAFLPEAVKVANVAKEIFGDIKIVVGGYHPTAIPEKTLSIPSFDIAVLGEGEYTFLNLIYALERGKAEEVKGIAYKNKGKIVVNQKADEIKDLGILPWPAHHLLTMHSYRSVRVKGKKYKAATMISSRGCPFNCIFCVSKVMRKGFRVRAPEDVVAEMEYLCNRFNVECIEFMDDMFGLDRNWTRTFCKEIMERKLNISWTCISRCDVLSEDLLNLMRKSGCIEIKFGVETGDAAMMENIRKGETLSQVENAFKNSRKEGIQAHAFFMLGNPGESEKSIKNTQNLARRLCRYGASAVFAIAEVYPGSELEKMLRLNHNWLDAINPHYQYPTIPTYPNFSGIFNLDRMHEIKNFLSIETTMLTYYRNPKYVFNMLRSVRSFPGMFFLGQVIIKYIILKIKKLPKKN